MLNFFFLWLNYNKNDLMKTSSMEQGRRFGITENRFALWLTGAKVNGYADSLFITHSPALTKVVGC